MQRLPFPPFDPILQPARRRLLKTMAVLPAAAWLPGCGGDGDPAPVASEPTPFTYEIGVRTVPGTALINATIQDLGLWTKHGVKPIDPVPIDDRREWTPEAENNCDVRLYGMGATINYLSKGVQFTIIGDLGTRAEWHMWTLADKPIALTELKGKRFAVTQLAGTDRFYVDLFLKSLGINPDDIVYVPTGGVGTNYTALKEGKADIWVTTEHTGILTDRENLLRSMAKISDYVGTDWDPYVVLAKRSTLKEKPGLVREAATAIFEAVQHIGKAPRQENLDRLMKLFKVDQAMAERLFATVSLNPSGKIKLSTIEKMRNHYIENGLITAESAPLSAIYDPSILGTR
ncbi:MAG: hypothetical protein ABS43_29505 [Bordetella sp. SCN 67-23]|nr:MAG: hypothetical protein ABS43_29505 [Bordetella sp. SCN 67-23]OJW89887.1 MAG: hypothetical protein BGO71_26510 [Burkholderiales bacterium 67-32]